MTQRLKYHTAMADLYSLLEYLLQFPTQEMVDQMARVPIANDIEAIFDELGFKDDSTADVLASFSRLQERFSAGSWSLSSVRQSYTRLFMHPKHPLVIPYEGLFLDARRVESGLISAEPCMFVNPSAVDASSRYKECDIAVSNHSLPPDHVCVELEFASKMHALIACELVDFNADSSACAEAEDGGDGVSSLEEKLQEFEKKHLLNWVPEFCGACTKEDADSFYGCVGRFGLLAMKAAGRCIR